MRNKKISKSVSAVLSALVIFYSLGSSIPVNAEGIDSSLDHFNHGFGYLRDPSCVEVPIVGVPSNSEYPLLGEPRYYNAYELGFLPAIRNQGQESCCWAFANVGAVETDLIHDGAGNDIDLSELQIVYYTSHMYNDPVGCHNADTVSCGYDWLSNGGCAPEAYRAMMEGIGLIPENDMPYRTDGLADFAPADEYAYGHNAYQIKGAYVISIEDVEGVKYAIRNHGGVVSSLHIDYTGTYYNSSTNAYYTDLSDINHQVMLVGWDDDFSKENFNESCRPSSDGAWLVRNSWGNDGYDLYGYFWISYEDYGLMEEGTVYAYDADNVLYDKTYAYFRNFFPTGSANIPAGDKIRVSYNAKAGEAIKAVGFETRSIEFTATATVTAGDRTATGSVTTDFAGFYVIDLDEDIVLSEDTNVVVNLTFDDEVDLLIEYPSTYTYGSINYSNKCDHGMTVIDETLGYPYQYSWSYDPLITMYTSQLAVEGITLNTDSLNLSVGETSALSVSFTPSAVTDSALTWSSSNTDIATVDSNGNICAVKPGTAVITVTTSNGKTATCNVTVSFNSVSYVERDGRFLLYRLYNPNSGEHFWTADGKEVSDLVNAGWNFEGNGWWAPTTGAPVYRLYNPNAGDHHYTMDESERNLLIAAGWNDEGVAWNSAPIDGNPLYRLYNPNAEAGSHHYTMSAEERDNLALVGWNYEGIGWYGYN